MSDPPINLDELRRREIHPDDWVWITPEERDALVNAAHGLDDLLAVAERIRGGDPSLDPEEWYAVRDYARAALARFAPEDFNGEEGDET